MNSMILHEIYFGGLGAAERSGPLSDALARDFGSAEAWAAQFSAMGKAQGGGSGWVLLAYSPRSGKLFNQWAADHTTTIGDGTVVLALDMYEHSYHIDYGAKAAGYVDAYMQNINWQDAAQRYERAALLRGSHGAAGARRRRRSHLAGAGGSHQRHSLPGRHSRRV